MSGRHVARKRRNTALRLTLRGRQRRLLGAPDRGALCIAGAGVAGTSTQGNKIRVVRSEPQKRWETLLIPRNARRVLVCLRYGIGDVVMELPALAALRRALPDAHITALANAPAHEIIEDDPRVDDVVNASRWGFRDRWDHGNREVRARVARWVEDGRFDLVLDADMAVSGVGQAIWSSGIRSLESDADVEGAAVRAGEGGVAAILAGVQAGWGLEVERGREPRVHIQARHHLAAESLFQDLGISQERPLALSPIASHWLKQWPCERFAAAADHAVEQGSRQVLIFEGPQADKGQAVIDAMRYPDAAVRIGAHHLLTTAALLVRCRGLVCNDTGIMHLAGAVGVQTLAVFGPTQAAAFLPPAAEVTAVEPSELDCPYRSTGSLHPPACWHEGSCLIMRRSCIHLSRTSDVITGLEKVLEQVEREPSFSESI